jgi:hypothetical protein
MYSNQLLSGIGIAICPVSHWQTPANIGVHVEVPSTISAISFDVYGTMDDPNLNGNYVSIARSTTTATVTSPNHGLSVGDLIIVDQSVAPFIGTFKVASITDLNTYTYTVANSGATSANATIYGLRTIATTIATATASADATITQPLKAVMISISSYTGTGQVSFQVIQGLPSP